MKTGVTRYGEGQLLAVHVVIGGGLAG